MEINRYIKDLLLLHDCVIIPQFGGFVANYKPAVVENNRFSPPSKEIAFNNKLVSNDGLLINHISETEGLGYFEAKQKLDNFLEESMLRLEQGGKVIFEGVGSLSYDQRENLQFEPQIRQNLLADSYGLMGFTFEKLYQRQIPQPAIRIEDREAVQVIFKKRNLKKALVGVPLVLALALIPLKNNKEFLSRSDMNFLSQFSKTVVAETSRAPEVKATAPTTNEETPTVNEEKPKAVAPIAEKPVRKEIVGKRNLSEKAVSPAAKEVNYKYYLIGGSFKSEENANKFMAILREKGFSPRNLGIYNGLYRIAQKGYDSFEQAQADLNAIKLENPGSGVWIHIN